MVERKVWCWEAAQAGYGPDWRFLAYITPGSEDKLDNIAAHTTLHGYTYYPIEGVYCQYHQQVCRCHSFIDTSNAQAYINNLKSSEQKNLWVYNTIEIHRDIIEIESGYGGRGIQNNNVETSFLLDIFTTPAIVLRHWEILTGGLGYDYRLLKEGSSVDTFRAYIKCNMQNATCKMPNTAS